MTEPLDMTAGADPSADAAATKIQAVQRGKAARKEVEGKKVRAKGPSPTDSTRPTTGGTSAPPQTPPGPLELSNGQDAQADAAATKIQAAHRGKASRKHINQRKAAAKIAADMPQGPEAEAAATKIQAIQRGKAARKEVKQYKTKQLEVVAESETLTQDLEMDAAATKIQAVQRGKAARKAVAEQKAQAALVEADVDSDTLQKELEMAASTVGRNYRGYKARKEVKSMRAEREMLAEQARKSDADEAALIAEQAALAEDAAASKIGAAARGRAARKQTRSQLASPEVVFRKTIYVATVKGLAAAAAAGQLNTSLAAAMVRGQVPPPESAWDLQEARHRANHAVRTRWTSGDVARLIAEGTPYAQYATTMEACGIDGERLLRLEHRTLPMMGIKQWDHIKVVWALLNSVKEFCLGLERVPAQMIWDVYVQPPGFKSLGA